MPSTEIFQAIHSCNVPHQTCKIPNWTIFRGVIRASKIKKSTRLSSIYMVTSSINLTACQCINLPRFFVTNAPMKLSIPTRDPRITIPICTGPSTQTIWVSTKHNRSTIISRTIKEIGLHTVDQALPRKDSRNLTKRRVESSQPNVRVNWNHLR